MSSLIGSGRRGTTKPWTKCSCGQCTEQLACSSGQGFRTDKGFHSPSFLWLNVSILISQEVKLEDLQTPCSCFLVTCSLFPLTSVQSRCSPLTLMDWNHGLFFVSESFLSFPGLSSNLTAAEEGEKKLRLGSLKIFNEIVTYQLAERWCFGVLTGALSLIDPFKLATSHSLKKASGPSKPCYPCLHWRYPQEGSQALPHQGMAVSSVQRWVLLWAGRKPPGCQCSGLCVWDTSSGHLAVRGLYLVKYILLWKSS